jgi:hypothetical protein
VLNRALPGPIRGTLSTSPPATPLAGSITLIQLSPAGLPSESRLAFITRIRPLVNSICWGVLPTAMLTVSPVERSTRVMVLRLEFETYTTESLIRAAPATPDPGASAMVFTSCPFRRSTTAMASRARSGTTAVPPRVVTLTGCTSDAPNGTVDTWVGAATGSRLNVAPVLLSTTTISSGAGGGAAVSAQERDTPVTRLSPNRILRRRIVMPGRSKHLVPAASRPPGSAAEPGIAGDAAAASADPSGQSQERAVRLARPGATASPEASHPTRSLP